MERKYKESKEQEELKNNNEILLKMIKEGCIEGKTANKIKSELLKDKKYEKRK